MKKTFDLLAKMKLKQLKQLKKGQLTSYLNEFAAQLRLDFAQFIATGFDVNKQAENWLDQIKALSDTGQIKVNRKTLEKIDQINRIYSRAEDHIENIIRIDFITVDMYLAYNTVLYRKSNTKDTCNVEETEENHKDIPIILILKEYYAYLTKKLYDRVGITGEQCASALMYDSLTNKQIKLIQRYQQIAGLTKLFNKKLDDQDISQIKKALDFCFANQPDASERSFLRKIADLFSGFKPLYRFFMTKEEKLGEQLNHELGPKLGG